jgi:ABC-2 type transport system permease protein
VRELAHLLGPRLRGLLNRWHRASRGTRTTTVLFGVLGLAFWVLIFGMALWMVDAFHSVEVFGPILTRKLLELLMLGMFGLLCFSNTVTALSTFYLSDDLELLLSLPVPRERFHIARLLDTLFQSSWMVMVFGVPVFIAYGMSYGADPLYYGLLCVVLPAFVLMPGAVGVTMATVLVTVFPARRLRELLVLVGVLSLAFVFMMLRVFRPERLVNAGSFDSLAAYVAEIQAPVPVLLPPKWAADVLIAVLEAKPFPSISLGLLITGAIAASGVARWITSALYDRGRTRAQEARQARLAHAGWMDTWVETVGARLGPAQRAVVLKDVKTFFRDPGQWSQLFLVGSIVVISLVSVAALPVDVVRGPWVGTFRNVLAFLVLGMVGFVMAAVAARFQFSAVSAEGRAYWLVRSAPLTAEEYLWSKMWPGIVPMLVLGEVLALVSCGILQAGLFLTCIAAGTALGLSFGIAGVAVGMGAMYPDFRADSAARVAAGPAGVLFMVMALILVFVVIGLLGLPVYFVLRAGVDGVPLQSVEWAGSVAAILAAIGVCWAATVVPLRMGAKRLWAKGVSND